VAYKVETIEGIGPAYGAKLTSAKIKTPNDLLKLCCTARGRSDVATKTGFSESQLLKWANMADMMRIKGIGGEFAELLEAAGVDTVKELKMRNAENLAEQLKTTNAQKKLTRRVPSATVVARWVAEAKQTTPTITH